MYMRQAAKCQLEAQQKTLCLLGMGLCNATGIKSLEAATCDGIPAKIKPPNI